MPSPSPSLDEFDQLAKKGPSRCKFGRLADELAEEDRAALDAAAEGPYEHMVFVKWFAARGLKLSDKGCAPAASSSRRTRYEPPAQR